MGARRVLIDGYFLGKPTGFGRFISELCRGLGNIDTDCKFVLAVPKCVDGELLKPYPNLRYHRMSDANFAVWEQIKIPLAARINR